MSTRLDTVADRTRTDLLELAADIETSGDAGPENWYAGWLRAAALMVSEVQAHAAKQAAELVAA